MKNLQINGGQDIRLIVVILGPHEPLRLTDHQFLKPVAETNMKYTQLLRNAVSVQGFPRSGWPDH